MIKLPVSIFGQTTGYRIYTVHREPIRLPEIQYPVRGICRCVYIRKGLVWGNTIFKKLLAQINEKIDRTQKKAVCILALSYFGSNALKTQQRYTPVC